MLSMLEYMFSGGIFMALCGFNKKMLDGLASFSEGLFEQLQKRAQEDGLSIEDALKQELAEMDTFTKVLGSTTEEVTVMKGITLLAQGLYKQSFEAGGDNSTEAVKERYANVSRDEIEFCRALDEEYYGKLRPNAENPHIALHQLGPWICDYRKKK